MITQKLLKRQAVIAAQDYLQRTGNLLSRLSSPIYTSTDNADGFDITIDYPATIRFLDLKLTAAGKKKRYYTAIYNRELFGHVYGKGYSVSNVISLAVHNRIFKYAQRLEAVLKEETL